MNNRLLAKFCCCVLLFSSFVSKGIAGPSHQVIEDRCGLQIATPSLSERKIQKLRLENKLEAILISDPGTHQSGAALAVHIGSWSDPEDRPGMAHFVEHMLFLGTEKYPEEQDYQRYLDEHGGNRNAFTMADRTVYMFSVNNGGFQGALDRFSQFFVSPLFNPSGVDRESKAIDQEFCKDLPLDLWRVHYVKKELANPKHPFHRFCIGNKETLAKISQDELKEWYKNHYSSDLMHLVVYSSLPLAEMEEQVCALFSDVKKIDASKRSIPPSSNLLTAQTTATMVAIAPVQELQTLELSWELPLSFGKDREVRADDLLSYVLGHEGPQSLLVQLKKEELAESLSAGTYHAGHNQSLFHLSIQLTAKGVEEYETVIQRCFEALATYRKSSFPKYLFEEIGKLKTMEYSFQQREEIFQVVMEMASGLIDEAIDTYPQKTLIPTVFSPEKVKELLNLMTPEKCHFTFVAPSKLSGIKTSHKEKWMGVEYGVLPFTQKNLNCWTQAKPHRNISFPTPNRFIPSELSLKKTLSSEPLSFPSPTLIIDQPQGRLYYSADDRFLAPEISWSFTIKAKEVSDADPKTKVLADLFCHTVKERLNAVTYEAEVAGLTYSLSSCYNGIKLTLKGYSEKAPELLNILLKEMTTLKPTEQEFLLYKDLAEREYANAANKTPVSQGMELMWGILYKDYCGVNEKETALQTISYDDFSLYCANLFHSAYLEGMMYGNLSEEESRSIWNQMEKTFQSSPNSIDLQTHREIALLPEGKDPFFIVKKSSLPGNVVLLTTDCGGFSFQRRAAHEILSKGLEEPFFSELRTRQQTAYLVANWSREIERHLYSFFIVQSGTHDTRDLLARFELFLESSLQNFSTQTIPKERFESIRTSLITQLENPAQNMEKMEELLHSLAFDYDGDFQWLEKRIKGLKELTYEEFQTYAQEFLGKANRRRMAICINGSQPATDRFRYRRLTTPKKIKSEIRYQSRTKE